MDLYRRVEQILKALRLTQNSQLEKLIFLTLRERLAQRVIVINNGHRKLTTVVYLNGF